MKSGMESDSSRRPGNCRLGLCGAGSASPPACACPLAGSWGSAGGEPAFRRAAWALLLARSLEVCFWNATQWQPYHPSLTLQPKQPSPPRQPGKPGCSASCPSSAGLERISGTKQSCCSQSVDYSDHPWTFSGYRDFLPPTPPRYAPWGCMRAALLRRHTWGLVNMQLLIQ